MRKTGKTLQKGRNVPRKSQEPMTINENSSATEPILTGSPKPKPPLALAGSKNGLMKLGKVKPNELSRKEGAWRRFIKGTELKLEQFRNFPALNWLGNRPVVIGNMRFSSDPVLVEFLKVWDKTPSCDRKQIPLALIAMKAGVKVNELIGSYNLCLNALSAEKSKILAMEAHPEVVAATIQFSKLPGGERDRRMLHENRGFLPTPKGLTINQNFGQGQGEDEDDDSGPLDVNDMFPMITAKQEKWQHARTKLLEGTE